MADTSLGPLRAPVAERLVVVWRVTTRCNLACGFCAYDRALPFARRETDEASARVLGRSLARLKGENERLRQDAELLRKDPSTIEDVARRELGMMKPGEKLFIVKDAEPAAP